MLKFILYAVAVALVAGQKGKASTPTQFPSQSVAYSSSQTQTTQSQNQNPQYNNQYQNPSQNQNSNQNQNTNQYQTTQNSNQNSNQQYSNQNSNQQKQNQNQNQNQNRSRQTIAGISRQPTPAAAAALLDSNDAVLLLLDHQTGLFQTVKDVPLPDLRNNVVVLAKGAQLAGAPIIYTASEPNGSNGPTMEELATAAPNATYVARQGEVSAWDNADFVAAVEATGRKTLIMAGVWTSVCVAFPALQALLDGYKVYAVFDASGDMSQMASQVTLARLTEAGVIPVTTNVILGEFQRTWNRPDAAQWVELYGELVPAYRAVGESYARAQQAATSRAPTPKARGL